MAIQTVAGGLWLPSYPDQISAAPSFGVSTIDAADEGAAFVLRVPKTGNVSKILWATRNVTTGATIVVRGETLDETVQPAIPSGTLYHANFNGSSVIANGDDNVAVLTSLAAAVAVTIGDKLAIIIKQPTASFGTMEVAIFGDSSVGFPYALLNTGVSPAVSWAVAGGSPIVGLEYDDGSYSWIAGCYPLNALTSTAFNNTSTPDEIGLRFKVPWPCRMVSSWLYLDADGDFNVNLYDSDGATKIGGSPLATDKDTRRSTAGSLQYRRLTSAVTLLANTFYRLVIEPSSATSLTFYDFTGNTAPVLDAFEGGQNFHLTSAKNPTQESDWTNTLTRRPFMGIGIDGFDDAVSAQGVTVPPWVFGAEGVHIG